jgi:hypothetical protein
MHRTSLIAAGAIAAALIGIFPANSQTPPPLEPGPLPSEDVMVGLREACDHGDRFACIKFGEMLGKFKERRAYWQRGFFPGWWAWERF